MADDDRRRRAALLKQAAALLDKCGTDGAEGRHAAALRLEARALLESLPVRANGMTIALSSITIDLASQTGSAVAAWISDSGRGSALVSIGPLEWEWLEGEERDDRWYSRSVRDFEQSDLSLWITVAIDEDEEALAAIARAVAAAGGPPPKRKPPPPKRGKRKPKPPRPHVLTVRG